MSLVINTNIAAMNGQRNLSATQAQQSQTFQRLSTGLRINSAKDDAAGLFLAQNQTKDIRGLDMATRNAGDGISMAQTAEGALDQIGNNLQRINELAIQSANGTYSKEAREGLQKEVNELTQEVNRIIETTEFNGQKLLNKNAQAETLQISFENNNGSRITTGMEGGMVALDGVDNVSFFGSSKSFDKDASNLDANLSTELANVTGFTLDESIQATQAGSFNGAKADSDLQAEVNQALKIFQGDHTTIQAAIAAEVGTGVSSEKDLISFNAKGMEFTINGTSTGGGVDVNTVTASYLDASESQATIAIATGAFSSAIEKDFTSGADIGTFVAASDAGVISVSTFESNGLKGIIDGGLAGQKTIDISTAEAARQAITQSRNAIDMVSEVRAEFGANMNRFEAVISGNQTYTENLSAARSRIQDADFAVETSNLAKQQVLQQAGVAALGQANASAQVVLGLL